jgi:hypothetical protein
MSGRNDCLRFAPLTDARDAPKGSEQLRQAYENAVGLHESFIDEIAKADNDWAFILKIEALY